MALIAGPLKLRIFSELAQNFRNNQD